MNKIPSKMFGRSKKSKDKQKKKEELSNENDFLYGRKTKSSSLASSIIAADSSRTIGSTQLNPNSEQNYSTSRKDPDGSRISAVMKKGSKSSSRRTNSTLPSIQDEHHDIDIHRNNNRSSSKKNDRQSSLYSSTNTADTMNTNYYRAESDMAVSSANSEYGSSPQSTTGHCNSPGDYEIPINDFEDDMKHNRTLPSSQSSQSIKLVSGGGHKTSGMDEMNKLTNDRVNKKSNTNEYNRKDSFEDRLHESMNSMASHKSSISGSGLRDSCNTLNSVEEEDYPGGEQQSRRKKSSKHRHKDGKHRKSHRRERHTDGVEEGDDHNKHRSSRRSSNNDDNDKVHKSSRRSKRRDQGEKERLKASIREELRSSANQQNASSTAAAAAAKEEESELEKRRRKQREQEEKDRKMKQSIKEQRDAAKDLRSSTFTSSHNNTSSLKSSSTSYDEDENYELEQRRRKQREQDEKDRMMKASIRQQRDAAKELRSSTFTSSVRGSHDEDDNDYELEQRRRRQRDQEENDRKMKASIRQERDAARGGAGGKRRSFGEDNNDQDAFEAGLGAIQLGPRRGNAIPAENEIENDDEVIQQNLIDLHIAQFRATSKISASPIENDEEYDNFEVDPNLEDFEEEEAQRNQDRRMSRRVSANTMKINAWQQKYSLKKALELAERTPEMEWASSFYRCDPRWQIMKFFDEVAREGGAAPMDENLAASPLANLFNKASVFTVWRPTSDEAIKNMMLGIATGKGLDIKGKSAKRGNISSYVPFIQIYEEPHKEHVRAYIKDGKTIRVFYQSEEARHEAHEMILDIKDFMLFAAEDAMRVLSDEYADPAEQELAMKHLMYDDTNLNVRFVDTYIDSAHPVYGLDITERLFWESYVMMQDCSRPVGTDWDIGRNSELTFMDMNFKSIRNQPAPGDPRAVVYQMSKTSPMEPRMLLMAYEEYGRVKPVVSDFDCFLLGSRGVKYKNPIPQDQLDLVKWSVKNISEVLAEREESGSKAGWMESWFKVLKKAALKGYYPKTPKYGNGDPKSYDIIEIAVSRLQETGCVRHGAECFNWFFPQEVDEEMLVISDTLPGNVKWKKVKVPELQEILITKIEEGFTFPINPKWVLCDPGWRRVYDKLLASKKPNVQDSIKCWLPPETGLREEIDKISAQHPLGFEGSSSRVCEGTEVMDQMQDDLERYLKIQRAWRKLRLLLFWIRFAREKRREREEKEAAAIRGDDS